MARCFVRKGDDGLACTWLGRYIELAREKTGPELAGAHLTMGRCLIRMGELPKASLALHRALAAKPSRPQRTDITMQLSVVLKDRGRCLQALGMLEKIDLTSLTARQQIAVLLTKARTYRAMGLAGKALTLLRRRLPDATDQAPDPSVLLEMAHCHIEMGDHATARRLLTELLPRMKPGKATVRASCDLAETCLAEGKPGQAAALGESLLTSTDTESLNRALNILGEALARQGRHERAALAFSGILARPTGESEK